MKLNNGFIFVIVIFFALFLRTFQLDNRPLHTDEAVHAVKFGELLEEGSYIYDPIEYHGPTLNYFTLISATILNNKNFIETTEYTLRLVPALLSLIVIILFITVFRNTNSFLAIIIAFLLAISPVFVFYGRYYIQETLLVTFTYSVIITFYYYFLTKKKYWIFLSAVFTALIFSTKETSIITFSSAIFTLIVMSKFYGTIRSKLSIKKIDVLIFLFTAITISALFYSSFFTNSKGIIDSITTFSNYFGKAGSNVDHIQPWYYYFELMLFTKNDLLIFTQIPLFIFTIIGIYFSFLKNGNLSDQYFFKFVSMFSIIQAFVYSLIPYKTPWLLLNFWIGFLILASYGIFNVFIIIKNRNYKRLSMFLIVIILGHNIIQTYITSFGYPYQPENPFTYSQTTPEIISVTEKIIGIVESKSNRNETVINVIVKNNDYWPLPWYLRKLKNVAWNDHVPKSVYRFPIIISTPEFENEIINNLYNVPPPGEKNLYVPIFDENTSLRPGVELRGYIQKDLNDYYLRSLDETSNKIN